MKNLIYIIVVLIITFAISAAAAIKPGDAPFDDVGKTINGEKIKISDYKNKVVIVTFWATWCPACMKEIPVLSGIQNKAGEDNIQIIAINYKESKEMFKNISEALKSNKIIFTHDRRGRLGKKYKIKGIPYMLLIGGDGLIEAMHTGYSEESLPSLVAEINQLIADNQKTKSVE